MEGNVSNHLGVRNNTNEEVNRTKFGQSDERTVYEVQHGTQPNHGDYCSITIDDGGGLDNEMLQQRIHSVYRQREDLHNMEVELRAQIMARSAIVEMKNSFDVQMKEHVNAYEELKHKGACSAAATLESCIKRSVSCSNSLGSSSLIEVYCMSNWKKGKASYTRWNYKWKRKIESFVLSL
ncbi:uncharacterized protein LOC113304543 isoform X3 [Papaver somniferum]|uniref:uncharacterized protein LOC113304543 isoform X3 n=1 Tax=Papaver somniferum TaxID=3469 RepID=UPI000E6F63B0|nr:uncharacterized protein LOC113304543 isoform X3 [Papaver somniferum]